MSSGITLFIQTRERPGNVHTRWRGRSTAHPSSEEARSKTGGRGISYRRASSRPEQRDTGDQNYPIGQWASWTPPYFDAHDWDEPVDPSHEAELSSPLIPYRAPVRESPSSRSATGITTGPDLQMPEGHHQDIERPVRTSDSSDLYHLFPTHLNENPNGTQSGGPYLFIF